MYRGSIADERIEATHRTINIEHFDIDAFRLLNENEIVYFR